MEKTGMIEIPAFHSSLGPVRPRDRIAALDILRGSALLGILVMNIQIFAMIMASYRNPTTFGNLTGANYWVWYLSHLLADQKFMTIFSMLFGAGILLMAGKADAAGGKSAATHFRRMGALLIFGLMHAYLLWYGDILVLYAICGSFAFLFRRRRPRFLIVLGLLILSVSSLLSLLGGISMPMWPASQVEEVARGFTPHMEAVTAEVEAYRGGWLKQMEHRVPTALDFQTTVFLFWGLWRAAGLMLVGMGLFRLGVFSAERPARFYWALLAIGAVIGVPLAAYGVGMNETAGWDIRFSFFQGQQYNYWASLLGSMGWVGAVMLACRNPRLERVTRPLAAVGRTAFSNYILQTVICTLIFYGHGFGLFGSVERIGQIAIVLAVWVVQLLLSTWWLRRFQYGPLEWLLRSVTYMQPMPFRKPRVAV